MHCDNLEGGMEEEMRDFQEGGDICILWLVHVDVWQRRTQYCKAIILQLKIIKIFKVKKKESDEIKYGKFAIIIYRFFITIISITEV